MIDLDGLRPEQRDIVTTLDEPLFVAAGAGSGKTFTLTRRIAWALTPGSGTDGSPFIDSLDQVLVITFTSAAALEIKERVRSTLRESGMAEAALGVDSAWISTIHGMCSRILHENALELGLDPDFQVARPVDCELMREEAVEAVFGSVRDDPAYAGLLSTYPARGGRFGAGDAPGSVFGMVSRVCDLAAAAPDGFDSLSWPGAAADPVSELRGLLTCYQALAANQVKDECENARMASAVEALEGFLRTPASSDVSSAYELVRDRVGDPNGGKWRAKAVHQLFVEARAARDKALCELALGRASEFAPQIVDLAHQVSERYSAAKRAAAMLDNDDLLRRGLDAVREHPDVAAAYSDRFRLVMVDEFQDTSAQQVELVRLLSGGARRLATVGDAQQSIYRFRGADVSVFRRREADSRSGDGRLARLTMNFRSHDDVLRFVADVCGGVDADGCPLLDGFMDLDACPTRKDLYQARSLPRVAVEVASSTKVKVAGGPAAAPSADVRRALLADQVANRLAGYAAAGQHASDMALLLGSMSHAGLYVDALRAHGLDCVVTGGSTFSSAPETQVMAALLHVLANPHDTKTGLYPVLGSDMFALDADDLCALATCTQDVIDAPTKRGIDRGLFDMTFRDDVRPSRRLRLAHDVLVSAWGRMGSMPVADVMLDVLRESGWLARLEGDGVEGRAVAANLLACVRYVRELTEDVDFGPVRAAWEFDHWLEATKVGPASLVGGGFDAVRVMTVHASKGLEFPVVAVAETCDRPKDDSSLPLVSAVVGDETCLSLKTPDVKAAEGEGDPSETPSSSATLLDWRRHLECMERTGAAAERGRLLYVALTRAREAVVLALDAPLDAKGTAPSDSLSTRVLAALSGHGGPAWEGTLPAVGEATFGYGGSAPAAIRRVDVCFADSRDQVTIDAAGSLPTLEGTRAVSCLAATDPADVRPSTFALFEGEDVGMPATHGWSAHEGVYSYSSAHAAMVRDLGPEAVEGAACPDGATSPDDVGCGPAVEHAVGPADDAAADTDASTMADGDKATNLGSAFHELAQLMIETGKFPDVSRVDAVARAWHVSRRQRTRLDEALARWRDSSVRRELLSHGLVRAEVPFFREVDTAYGRWCEGAMDALGTDPASPDDATARAALVVDYKTGDADKGMDELRASHAMQARFYAGILLGLGFTHVDCAFVCVERDDGHGEPVVVRYAFDAEEDLNAE